MTNTGNLRGIASMLVAVGFLAAMDAVLKVFAGYYPPMQVGAMRGAASIIFILMPLVYTGRWGDLRPVRWRLHLLRGVLAVVMLWGFIYAISQLSLADAYAIFFVAPLFVTALSVPILGDRVSWRRWVAIGVGMLGVIYMLQPTGAGLSVLGALGAVASAFAYALSVILARVLTRTDTTVAMVFWFLVLLTIFAGLIATPSWVPIRSEHWLWLGVLGIVGALGQHFVTEAFRQAPPAIVAPFEYTAILWAVTFDWIIWSALPDGRVYIGAPLVIGCGLYIIWRERAIKAELAAAEGQAA
jgi:drug/metabolite transporter (DMT)-like permease